jgi:hypothetical protein
MALDAKEKSNKENIPTKPVEEIMKEKKTVEPEQKRSDEVKVKNTKVKHVEIILKNEEKRNISIKVHSIEKPLDVPRQS